MITRSTTANASVSAKRSQAVHGYSRRLGPTEHDDVHMNEVAALPRVLNPSEILITNPLDRRAVRAMARARLYSELRSIALDLLGPCDPDELPVEMSAWVEYVAGRAASAVCDTSMSALIRSLESTVERAPREIVHRLDQAGARHDVGID